MNLIYGNKKACGRKQFNLDLDLEFSSNSWNENKNEFFVNYFNYYIYI